MTFINTTDKTRSRKKSHANFMGGVSFDISNPLTQLRVAASSCFFGEPMYYNRDASDKRKVRTAQRREMSAGASESLTTWLDSISPVEWRGKAPAELLETAIDAALNHNAEATLEFAVELRNDLKFRTTPQVILVRAANHKKVKGTGLVRRYAKDIISRADEPSVGMAYQLQKFGRKNIPNSLKRAWKDALERFTPYQLAKYRMENRQVKTVDVVNLVHPRSEAVNALVRGKLKTTGQTWESIVSEGGSNTKSWTEAVDVMGHMALLRNLRNFDKYEVNPKIYLGKLLDTAEKGKQLPFRYYSAYKAVEGLASGQVLDTIEECMTKALGNLPFFQGRTMSLVDNSGSAQGATSSSMGTVKVSTIGNLTGVLTGMVSEDGYVGVFGDNYKRLAIRRKASIFDQLKKVEEIGHGIGLGTEHGIWSFLDEALRKGEHWDNIFVYSDMQAGHGGLYGTGTAYADYTVNGRYIDVPKLINRYRAKVNPNVNVFLVQTAGYQDTLIPEFYKKTYILGGWSESVLRFAANMNDLMGQQ